MGIRRRGKWLLRGVLIYGTLCLSLAVGSTMFTRDCSIIRTPYDVAIVLGGGLDTLHFVRDQKLGRVDAAVALYARDRITRLHLSGGGDDHTSSTARALARIAMDSGVPEIAITQETQSLSTLQNALFSLPDLPEDASLLIVTEGYHAWRSWASFLSGRGARATSVQACHQAESHDRKPWWLCARPPPGVQISRAPGCGRWVNGSGWRGGCPPPCFSDRPVFAQFLRAACPVIHSVTAGAMIKRTS